MELRDYVSVLRKHVVLILVCTLLAAASALVMTVRSTPLYRASVGFFVSTADTGDAGSGNAYAGSLFSQQRVKSYASIVAGPLVAARVAEDMGEQPDDVEGRITAAAVEDTVLLTVSVTDASPQHALAIAQSIAKIFPQLADELERPSLTRMSTVKVSVIQEPRLPRAAFSPQPERNLGLAVVLGLLVGVGLAVLREALDNTVKTAEGILAATGTATLGAIAFDPNAGKKPLIVQDDPQSPRAEAFRQLRTNLQYIEVDEPLRSLVLTSSVPKEGKSTTACNLAITMAQAGVRTVLIEGDLRRPRIADYLGIEGSIGLTSVLIGRVSLEDALHDFGDGTLRVLASGPLPPNPSELLTSRGMRDLIARLEREFEMVIIDAPPLLPVTDAAVLATMTSGAVLGVRCGSTRRDQLRRAAESLTSVDAKILGSVLNMVPRRGLVGEGSYGGYGGYGSYKSYGSNPDKPRMSADDAALALRGPRAADAEPAQHEPAQPEPAQPEPAPQPAPEPAQPEPAQPEPQPVPAPSPTPAASTVPRPGPPRPGPPQPQQQQRPRETARPATQPLTPTSTVLPRPGPPRPGPPSVQAPTPAAGQPDYFVSRPGDRKTDPPKNSAADPPGQGNRP